jgi:hypothetical protein
VGSLSNDSAGSARPDRYTTRGRLVRSDSRDVLIAVDTGHRQQAAAAACQSMAGGDGVAYLEAEPDSSSGTFTVRVVMYGATVGHLSKTQAVTYRAAVSLAAKHGEYIAAAAFADCPPGSAMAAHIKLRLPAVAKVLEQLRAAYSAL